MSWLSALIVFILLSLLVLAVRKEDVKTGAPKLPGRTRIKEINRVIQKAEFLDDLRRELDNAEIQYLFSIPLSSPSDVRRINYLLKRLGPKQTGHLLSKHMDQG